VEKSVSTVGVGNHNSRIRGINDHIRNRVGDFVVEPSCGPYLGVNAMNVRLLILAALSVALCLIGGGNAAEKTKADIEKSKAALQELGELGFIGQWKLSGDATIDGKKTVVNELWDLGWKFDKKTGDAWMVVTVKDGKFFTSAVLTYDVAKKTYLFTAKDKADTELPFVGKLVKDKLVLERKDPKSGDVYKLSLNTLSEGVRFNGEYDLQTGGKGLATRICKLTGGKEGESFAGGKKKNECCVTGGAGTIPVSFGGKTYYVCCSGCKEAFEENPKKVVEDYEKSKKK